MIVRTIRPEVLARKWLDTWEHPLFLDVTADGSYNEGHPPFAVNIPLERLGNHDLVRSYLDNSAREVMILTDTGDSSLARQAAEKLAGDGYGNLYVVEGGKAEWRAEGLPLEKMHYPPPLPFMNSNKS